MMPVETPQSLCRLGVARGDITPPVGIYHRMWGAAAHDRSTGVHRPLMATALALAPASPDAVAAGSATPAELVLVALDHCLLWAGEIDALRRAVCQQAQLPLEALVVAFSHTHAAGLMGWERAELPGGELIRPYLEELARRVANLAIQARAEMRPATLVYGTGRCSLAAQRDLWDDEAGQYVCGYNPQAAADDTLLVARATDDAGRLLALLVNYACHPTTLAWGNTLISPDYVGALRETVEGAAGAPCVFIQGASGDLGPREGFVSDVAVADRNGRQLAYAALAALEALPPPATRFAYTGAVVSGATIGTWAYQPLDAAGRATLGQFAVRRMTVALAYRPGLPRRDDIWAQRQRWREEQRVAQAAGEEGRAAQCRAMVERADRQLVRLEGLAGDKFDYPVTLCRVGRAVWVAVEGEPYQRLQTELRHRFPHLAVVVCVLANGSRCSYLPPRGVYGTGIYQETIAVLAPGSLERLIEAIAGEMWKLGD
jgi:hypothetical protein